MSRIIINPGIPEHSNDVHTDRIAWKSFESFHFTRVIPGPPELGIYMTDFKGGLPPFPVSGQEIVPVAEMTSLFNNWPIDAQAVGSHVNIPQDFVADSQTFLAYYFSGNVAHAGLSFDIDFTVSRNGTIHQLYNTSLAMAYPAPYITQGVFIDVSNALSGISILVGDLVTMQFYNLVVNDPQNIWLLDVALMYQSDH